MSQRTVHVLIQGRVQRVGYRAWCAAEASQLGLSGWVRNRTDGDVEALFSGAAEAVDAMIAACRDGPLMARVDELTIREEHAPVAGPFKVLPTM